MNKSFSNGNRIITSYRNSKNYGSNWISAGTALWFLRESSTFPAQDPCLGSAVPYREPALFHREIIERSGGWKFSC